MRHVFTSISCQIIIFEIYQRGYQVPKIEGLWYHWVQPPEVKHGVEPLGPTRNIQISPHTSFKVQRKPSYRLK